MGVTVDMIKESGNKYTMKLTVSREMQKPDCIYVSPKCLCGVNFFQVKIEGCYVQNMNFCFLIRFTKLVEKDTLLYICKVSSDTFNLEEFAFTDDNKWQLFHCQAYKGIYPGWPTDNWSFVLNVTIDVAPSVSPYANIYDDTVLTDFELHSNKNLVNVHKTVLASASPVFYKMLSGEWKETKQGHVEIPNTSIQALNNFKEYIYLNKLPENDIESLVLLGKYYSMPDLVNKCCVKLMNKMTEDNALELVRFALKYEVSSLLINIFKSIQNGVLNIDNIEYQF